MNFFEQFESIQADAAPEIRVGYDGVWEDDEDFYELCYQAIPLLFLVIHEQNDAIAACVHELKTEGMHVPERAEEAMGAFQKMKENQI